MIALIATYASRWVAGFRHGSDRVVFNAGTASEIFLSPNSETRLSAASILGLSEMAMAFVRASGSLDSRSVLAAEVVTKVSRALRATVFNASAAARVEYLPRAETAFKLVARSV